MDLTSLLVVAVVVGGLLVALLMRIAQRRRPGEPAGVRRADAGKGDINISSIPVAGVGGLGLVAVAFALAWSFPRIGETVAIGALLGVGLAAFLILRRRRAGPMPTSGRRAGANTTLSIDEPADSTTADAGASTDHTGKDLELSARAV
jgi:hypothetical protein